jgi:hypothetical protein
MTVSKTEVDQMASFMRALKAEQAAPPDLDDGHGSASGRPARAPALAETTGSIQEMKLILERFHTAAGNAVSKVNDNATYDRELREALVTEKTERGSRIGAWNIEMREEGNRKFYSVVQEDGVTCIASDLLLYEAAHGLVRILNNGGRLNSKPAINLLRAEQEYASALNDAVLYKHYLMKNPNDKRVRIFEAKYSVATRRAISARDEVCTISEQH